MIVLQGQKKIFLSKSNEGIEDIHKQYTNITFTPTQADRFVLAFRNWLRLHGQSQPEWFGASGRQPLPSTYLSREQMLDRFDQHARVLLMQLRIVIAGAAILFTAIVYALHELGKNFIYVDYVHAEIELKANDLIELNK
ncbi:hypothetical protein MLD38_011677 [Melastoma candidum]|nr:hypothetical protein MLD38_011677 [Melastoma candidum]